VQSKLREFVSRADYDSDANYNTARNALTGRADHRVRVDGGTTDRLLSAKLGEVISVLDFGADPTGVADSTPAIQAAINAAARTWGVGGETTGAVVFVPGGRYVLGSSLTISNNAGVSLVGEGKTKSNLIAGDASMVVLDIVNNNNARMFLHGLRIHGGTPALGIAIRTSSSGNQIDVRDCWIDTFAKGIVGNPNSDSYVTGCTMEFVAKVLELTASNDITFAQNTIVDCGPISLGAGSFDPMFDITSSHRIDIFNNRIIATSAMSPQPNGVVRFSSCVDCSYEHNRSNRVASYAGPFIKSQNNTGLLVTNNFFGRSTEHTILDIDSTDLTVDGNIFAGTTGGSMMTVELRGTAGWSVQNNKFRNNGGLYDFQGVNGTGLIRDGVLDGNKFALGYNITPIGGNMYVGKANVGGVNRAWLGSAPTTGTWTQNDVVWIPATAGNFAGFICTASGTPGTWRTFAGVSA